MSSENLLELISIASQCLEALNTQNDVLTRIADSVCKAKRPRSMKSNKVEERIVMMLAWIGHTNETSQVKLAEHFNVDPSSIRGEKYEPVRLAISMNKAAARRGRRPPKPRKGDHLDE
ncbi:MAG: hypothetical protein NXI04_04690 [Planctomycetaceae bacterium]|nr:hypothetical protein [Planctomycetaceae bacterium]